VFILRAKGFILVLLKLKRKACSTESSTHEASPELSWNQ